MSAEPRPTRRAVLAGSLALLAAACKPHRATPAPPPPDDLPALAAAVSAEEALLATYDALIASDPALAEGWNTERSTHAAHLGALRGLAPTSPSPTGTPTPVAADQRGLRTALVASAQRLSDAAITARSGGAAAVLASIAASHSIVGHTVTFSSSVSLWP